jgi:hypothetical protein
MLRGGGGIGKTKEQKEKDEQIKEAAAASKMKGRFGRYEAVTIIFFTLCVKLLAQLSLDSKRILGGQPIPCNQ